MPNNNILNTLQGHLAKQKTPEKIEFGNASMKFLRKRMFWRFQPQSKRTQDLNDFLNSLSSKAFSDNIDMILLQVNISMAECKLYSSDQAQLNAVIKRLPRLGIFQSRTLDLIKKQRRKYGL